MPNNIFLQPNAIITRNNTPAQAELDDEIVMMSLEQGNYYGFGTVGSRIWELIEQPTIFDELITQLQKEYEIDQDTCAKDTLQFLHDLLEHNLITVNG